MSFQRPSLTEIDGKLRDDFRRGMREYGVEGDISDPLLSILFRSLATRIAQVYSETDAIQLLLLDELLSGINLPGRTARAAQAIVRFSAQHELPVHIEAGTELLAESGTGERLTFTVDAGVTVSKARLVLACIYGDGQLRLLRTLGIPDEFETAKPSFDPVPASCGPVATLYLCFENLPDTHLSHHGLSFFLTPYAHWMPRILASEPWCIARDDGSFAAAGLLRPVRGNAGIQVLNSLSERARDPGIEKEIADRAPELLNGSYHKRSFVFGAIPPDFRGLSLVPRGLEVSLPKLFAAGAELFRNRRAWVRIFLPCDPAEAARELQDIQLHTVTASNVECSNQTIYFAQRGRSIPVSRESGTSKYLIRPLSVVGESGAYKPACSPSLHSRAGRYSIGSGYLNLTPGKAADDRLDEYVNLRLWVTDGERGNYVPAGSIRSFLRTAKTPAATVISLTGAAGGKDLEQCSELRDRFSYALLSRDRVVTRTDLKAACRAFDGRVLDAQITTTLRRTSDGLQRIHQIRVCVDAHRFTDLAEERVLLTEELQRFLSERTLVDVPIEVEVQTA
ncbi:MAG TPA: hypothetical protein VHZ55_02890 [Bryobacteraceae bacterium]|jgi:hypothetical protein|nr:hypothetical protein [Bryobacteraceae bacterium]